MPGWSAIFENDMDDYGVPGEYPKEELKYVPQCPHCHSAIARKHALRFWEEPVCLNDQCHERQEQDFMQEIKFLAYFLDPYDPDSWKSRYNKEGEFQVGESDGMPQPPLCVVR